jgi:hypothetical protein
MPRRWSAVLYEADVKASTNTERFADTGNTKCHTKTPRGQDGMKSQRKRGSDYGSARYNWAGMPVHKEHLQASARKHDSVKLEKLMNVLVLVAVSKELKKIRAIGAEYDDDTGTKGRTKAGY